MFNKIEQEYGRSLARFARSHVLTRLARAKPEKQKTASLTIEKWESRGVSPGFASVALCKFQRCEIQK